MSGQVLYSTNPRIKLLIQERFRRDRHYVWCSESFDSTALGRYNGAALIPPSSNPRSIYRELRDGVRGGDRHNDKINNTRTSLKALATTWQNAGEITADEKQEIVWLADNPDLTYWNPLVYVIPRHIVASRLILVPVAQRASFGAEYIIQDLDRNEFDIIEFPDA